MNLKLPFHFPYFKLFQTAIMASNASISTYERMTGGCTLAVAEEMLSTISPPITPTSYILDNACGPGIVSAQIKASQPDAKIMATDLSPAMIAEVQAKIKTAGWRNVEAAVLDARDLSSLRDETFTHVIVNLGLPTPGDREENVKVVREAFRVLKPGGVAMLSTWADRVWLNAFSATARAIRPHVEPQTSLALGPHLLRGSWLLSVLEDGGFGNNVELRPCKTHTSAGSLDELVENMMLAKQMAFLGYSDEELERAKPILKEELRNLRTYEEVDGGGVRIGMKAWIGIGWRKLDAGVVPC